MISGRNPAGKAVVREDVIEALTDIQCDANLVERTRRAMRVAALTMAEQRRARRRNMGIALIAVLSILVLCSPVIWDGVEALTGGEHVADLTVQVALQLLVLFPAMLAALIAVWKGQRSVYHDRRGS